MIGHSLFSSVSRHAIARPSLGRGLPGSLRLQRGWEQRTGRFDRVRREGVRQELKLLGVVQTEETIGVLSDSLIENQSALAADALAAIELYPSKQGISTEGPRARH